jgi:hypothetical protein
MTIPLAIALLGCQSAQEKPGKEAPVSSVPLTGFLGIPWGAAQQTAKAKIASRKDGATLYKETPFMLFYRDGELLDEHIDLLRLYFSSKGFYSGTAHFNSLTPTETDRYVQRLKGLLVSKYGEPNSDAAGTTRWRFADDNAITVEYTQQGLGIYYVNMKMSGDALVEEKEYDRKHSEDNRETYLGDL